MERLRACPVSREVTLRRNAARLTSRPEGYLIVSNFIDVSLASSSLFYFLTVLIQVYRGHGR
jgi:hypothetical protein